MQQLLLIREYIKTFFSRNEAYTRPVGKFIMAMVSLILINSKIGYASKLSNFAVTVILSLVCSFLPANFIVILSGMLMLLHLYSLSLEAVIVVGVMLILMYLMYFRFSPKDTFFILMTPVCFMLKIPYVAPIAAGLVTGVSSVVSVGCGVVIYYIVSFISANADSLKGGGNDEMVAKLRFIIDELLTNKEMLMLAIGFAVTIVVVNIIRRLSVDHAWTIAIVIGTMCNIVVVLVGDLKFGTYISIPGLIIGSIIAVLIVTVVKFFAFNVDYSKTEKVQFEDDDYYYYVKAVPKNNIRQLRKQVRKSEDDEAGIKKKTSSNRTSSKTSSVKNQPSKNPVNRNVSRNKNEGKRIIQEGESLADLEGNYRQRHNIDSNGMTGIERAAAAKARANRNQRV